MVEYLGCALRPYRYRTMSSGFLRIPLQACAALAVGTFVITIEGGLCGTAWGGPFTVLILPFVAAFQAGIAVAASLVLGLFLLLPGVGYAWRRLGRWSLLVTLAAILFMICAGLFGLRKTDPVSGYRMMPPAASVICYVAVVFPIVHLPRNSDTED